MLDAPRPFLDVTRSVTGRAWVDRLDAGTTRIATAMSQRSSISEILARVIAARGVGLEEAEAYLEPTIRGLMPDPSTLTAMAMTVWVAPASITPSEVQEVRSSLKTPSTVLARSEVTLTTSRMPSTAVTVNGSVGS